MLQSSSWLTSEVNKESTFEDRSPEEEPPDDEPASLKEVTFLRESAESEDEFLGLDDDETEVEEADSKDVEEEIASSLSIFLVTVTLFWSIDMVWNMLLTDLVVWLVEEGTDIVVVREEKNVLIIC